MAVFHNSETTLWIMFTITLFQNYFAKSLPEKPIKDKSAFEEIEEINQGSLKKLFEGDIVPSWFERQISDELDDDVKRDAKRNRAYLWRTKVVPYEISSNFSHKEENTIKNAIKVFEEKTCLRFQLYSNESNWIKFMKHDGCFSPVGKQFTKKGHQIISLGDGCVEKKIILHEVMHSLGFWHEQSRPDRNDYIEIFWENIQKGQEYNFNKYTHLEADVLGVAYDYDSIMHYGKTAYSINGKPTILAIRKKDQPLGKAKSLSSRDIIQINALYDCKMKNNEDWSSWSNYGPCDRDCFRKRQRFCSHDNLAKCPNANAHGVAEEKLKCTDAECYAPVNGHWGRWSSWGPCIPECGPRKQFRKRYCSDPEPKYGGKPCSGQAVMTKECSIRKCVLTCDFEEQQWCQWKDDPSNTYRMKWKRKVGPTPSKNTGPSGDHTTGKGHYIFTETSSPAIKGDKAKLTSNELNATNGRCLSFWYHMYGKGMGTLRIKIKNAANVEQEIWKQSGNKGNQWIQFNKTIVSKEPYKIIFEAEKGKDYSSDMALDDILFTKDKCHRDLNLSQKVCGVSVKPLGCYKDSRVNRALPKLLDTHRENLFHKKPFKIDWFDYRTSINELFCHCANRAKSKGYKYFGIQYYGECWAGHSESEYKKFGASDYCFSATFKQCSIHQDLACTGGAQTNYVYALI